MPSRKKSELSELISERIDVIINSQYGGKAINLARALSVPPQTVHGWKNGIPPGAKHLEALCRICGVDVNWLLTGRGTEPTTPLALDDPSLEGLGRVALVFATYPEARKRIVDNARRLAKAIEDERREGGPNQHPPLYQ